VFGFSRPLQRRRPPAITGAEAATQRRDQGQAGAALVGRARRAANRGMAGRGPRRLSALLAAAALCCCRGGERSLAPSAAAFCGAVVAGIEVVDRTTDVPMVAFFFPERKKQKRKRRQAGRGRSREKRRGRGEGGEEREERRERGARTRKQCSSSRELPSRPLNALRRHPLDHNTQTHLVLIGSFPATTEQTRPLACAFANPTNRAG
jgi:hypothetical protein